jgi:hypothetical protein
MGAASFNFRVGTNVGGTFTLSGDDSRAILANAGQSFTFDRLRVGGNYAVRISGDRRGSYPCIYNRGDPHLYVPLLGTTNNAVFSDNSTCSGASEVTGLITTAAKIPIAGVLVTGKGSATKSDITSEFGTYGLANLPAGTYTVTPTSSQFTFTPVNLNVNLTSSDSIGADFTGKEGYLISGVVRLSNGSPIAGATVAVNGSLKNTAVSDASGRYSIYAAANETSTVSASKRISHLPPRVSLSQILALIRRTPTSWPRPSPLAAPSET